MKKSFCLTILIFSVYFQNFICYSNEIINPLIKVETAVVSSFSTSPAADSNGTITICQGQKVTYTNTSAGNGSSLTFAWSFPGGDTDSAATEGPHTITYNIAGSYTATLIVNGASSSVNVVVTSPTSTAVIALVEGNAWGTSTFNGKTYFTYCSGNSSAPGGLFSFVTNSTNTSAQTQHLFDWGDLQSDSYTGKNLSDPFHDYETSGTFQLTYTLVNPGGCSITKTYDIYIGASPTATINSGGIPVLCSPGSVTYNIFAGAQNSPNTQYTIQVNDGSNPVVFNHPPPATYTHNYTITSCGVNSNINGTSYPNSFQASITASNPCGTSTSAIGPINIQTPPDADFTRTPNNNSICIGTLVTFNNTTTGGLNIGPAPNYTCTSTYKKYWTITGPSGNIAVTSDGLLVPNSFISAVSNFGFNTNKPNNSGAWTNTASDQLNITFNTPGNYTITLYTGSNSCGITSESQTICVNPEVIADFTLDPASGCAPVTVVLDNLSSLPSCSNTNSYRWQITPSNPENCPSATAPGWSFTTGNSTSFEPVIDFTSPGVYTVQLTTSLQNAVAGLLCEPDVKSQTITIKGKPSTTLTSETICEGTTITLNPTVFNCYATQEVAYTWDFGSTPPTSISSTTASNLTVTFATAGTYNYSLTLTNECGSSVFLSSITVNPSVQISASGPVATCLNTSVQLTGAISGGATTGLWTASVTGGIFNPNNTALSPTYTPPLNYTGAIQFTLTSAKPEGPCASKSITFPVNFNAQATVDAGNYPVLCQNASLQLNGIIGGAASSATWSSSIGGTFSNINSVTSTFTPPVGFTGPVELTLTTNNPDGPCNAEVDIATFTVIETPTMNPVNDFVVCHNTAIPQIIFTGTNSTNYSWTNNNSLTGLSASGTNPIAFTPTNIGSTPLVSTIIVTPFNTSNGVSCAGIPISFTITVNPLGNVNLPSSQVVCNGAPTTAIAFTTPNTVGTTTYNWSSSNPNIGLTPTTGSGNIASFNAINNGTVPLVTTITVTPTFSNDGSSCPGATKTFTITVNPTGQVKQPVDETFCNGAAVIPTAFATLNTGGTTTYAWTNNTTGFGLAASGTGNLPTFTAINTTNTPIIATITVTPTFTNGTVSCAGLTKTFAITINPSGKLDASTPQVVCNGTSTAAINFTTINTVGTTSYAWTNSATSIGLVASGSGDIASFNVVNTTSAPVIATITVTPTYTNNGVSCTGSPITFTITVNPTGQVTEPLAQTFCNGATTPSIQLNTTNTGGTTTYAWTNNNTTIGLGTSGTGNIPSFLASNTTNVPIVATITVIPTYTNGTVSCAGPSKTFTITINPLGQVQPITSQEVCNGTLISTINFTTTNTGGTTTTYAWTNSTPSIGLSATGSGNIASFNALNTTSSPIIATITVTPIYINNSVSCAGIAETFTITVNPSPVVSFSPINQVLCSGDTSALVTLSSATTGSTFSWVTTQPAGISESIVPSGSTTIPAQTFTNTTKAPITVTYVATASSSGSSNCPGSPYNYTITVNPRPSITESFTDAICSGESFFITPTDSTLNSIPTGTTYSWSAPVVTGSITGSVAATAQTTITGTLTNPTNTVQTATYTVTPTSTGCVGASFTVVISVNPKPVIPAQTTAICSETAFTITPTNAGAMIVPTGTTYTWTVAANTNITGQSASTATGITSISQTLTNTTNTVQTLTYTVTPTSGAAGNCAGTPFTVTVTVNPKPRVADYAVSSCSGSLFVGTPSSTSPNSIPTNTTYNWTVTNPTGITGASNQSTGLASIGQTLTNLTDTAINVVYNVTASSGIAPNNCTSTFAVTVTVNPTPTTLNLANLTYCNGVSTSEIVFTNNVLGTTYSWTNSNIAIGLAALGTGNVPVFTATNAGAAPITSTISVIATANGCSRTAETFTITVNPSPIVRFSLLNQVLCSGDTSALVTLSSTTSGVAFSWTAVQPIGITGVITSGTGTIPTQTLVNTTNAPITVTYKATAATSGASACVGVTYNYTITVNPRPSITESFTDAICSGTSFTVTPSNSTLNSIPTGTTYSWSAPVVTGGVTGGAAATAQTTITGVLNNPTNTVQTATYTVTPKYGDCAGASFTVLINVNPKPIITNQTATICSEAAFTINPINSGATIVPSGTTYTWTVGLNPNITGASASSDSGITTISQTLVNATNTAQIIDYTVTPVSGDTGNCAGSTFTITITVNPKPLVVDSTPAICSGTLFSGTPTNGAGSIVPAGTTYTWTTPLSNPLGAITGGSAQTTGVSTIGQILTNTTTAPATLEYTVTPTSGTCAGTPFTITVTVNPTPTTLGLTNQTYCSGVATSETIFTNNVLGTSYSWTNSNTAIGLAALGTGNISVFTATNAGTAPITSTISVIAKANGCSRIAETFTITVNPSPVVAFSPVAQILCSGDTSALVTLSSTTVGATFTWTASQPVGITGVITSGTGTIPVQTLVNTTNAPITITYVAIATTSGASACAGITSNYTITINPRPSIDNQPVIVICSEENFIVSPQNSVPDNGTLVPVGTTYNWTISNNPNITGASAGSGTEISQTLINPSNTIQSIIYTVTPIAGICTGDPFTITVNVFPKPDILFSIPNQTICNEYSTTQVDLMSTLTGNITFTWNATIPLGISGATISGTGVIPSQILTNTTNAPLTIMYSAIATFNNNGSSCVGTVYSYSITVNPTLSSSGNLSNYNGYNISVFGAADGAINLTTMGGSGVYTYSWTGPNGYTSVNEDLSDLVAGAYTVTINDRYCAPLVFTFILTQPPELLIQEDLSLTINLECYGNSNGAVGVSITQESVSPYDFELYDSLGNLAGSLINSTNLNPQFTGLIAGIYSLKVIDTNGGFKILAGLKVSQPSEIIITATTTPITCYGGNDASITLIVTGGVGPYLVTWNNLATGLFQNNLATGNYTITVTDLNRCIKTITVNIPEAPIFTINPLVVNVSCFGANDGSINLNLIGGISPLTLTWADGSTAGLIRNNLPPGTYAVTISDGTPCQIRRSFIIVEPQLLALDANVTNALDCNNANSGAINLLVSGGTPPFSYVWSNGSVTEDLIAVPASNYVVTVTDARNCKASGNYSIVRPSAIVLKVETITDFNCETKTVKQSFVAKASGGVPPFQYVWSSGSTSGSNNEIMNTSQNGLVILNALDSRGCSSTYTFDVKIPELGNPSFTTRSKGYDTYSFYSIEDPIQFSNTASGDFINVAWDFGDGTFSNEKNPIHIYKKEGTYVITQTVTYPFGCVYVHIITLELQKGYILIPPTAFTPNNDGINDYFAPVFLGLNDIHFDVYDTWGSLIYSESGENIRGWDGKINDKEGENGNYYFIITAKTFYGTTINDRGALVLIN
ncbi:gliding motility-associated C-terminal domain-containing protein [Flavobacterium segetis]|uniref:Gliding motility-associated C-terminal domain-containing protein n=1 Tax=Flavobacterium segetis TaxID=271157 RepID=A0A1M5FFC2_9FLAO|nr:PKD-like domain-containing protein [Flavobacterium segetis]SHF90240.1 gliding motility-associated C-terminal domain-containing protein [Flavobacterium segetis]